MILRSFQTGLLFLLLSNVFVIASETNQKQIETKRSGYWTYYCKNYEKQRQCEIARKINIEQQNETFLIIYTITKKINSKVTENLNIITPPTTRVNAKKRLKISFDEKTKFTRPFLECDETSCSTVFKGNRMIKYSLKNFNKMRITFYSIDDEEPVSLTLPMNGFAQAFDEINKQLETY